MKSVKSSIFLVDGMRMRKVRKEKRRQVVAFSWVKIKELGERGKEVGRFVGKLFSQSLSEESLLS